MTHEEILVKYYGKEISIIEPTLNDLNQARVNGKSTRKNMLWRLGQKAHGRSNLDRPQETV